MEDAIFRMKSLTYGTAQSCLYYYPQLPLLALVVTNIIMDMINAVTKGAIKKAQITFTINIRFTHLFNADFFLQQYDPIDLRLDDQGMLSSLRKLSYCFLL